MLVVYINLNINCTYLNVAIYKLYYQLFYYILDYNYVQNKDLINNLFLFLLLL